MHNNIRYLYLRNEPRGDEKRGFPIAVLAYSIYTETNESGTEEERAAYGVATFNPKAPDVVYNAKFLREIAVGKLILDHKSLLLPDGYCKSMHDIMWVIVTGLLHDTDLPKRTHKAIKNWLLEARKFDKSNEESDINTEVVNDPGSDMLEVIHTTENGDKIYLDHSQPDLGIKYNEFDDKPHKTIQQSG